MHAIVYVIFECIKFGQYGCLSACLDFRNLKNFPGVEGGIGKKKSLKHNWGVSRWVAGGRRH